MSYASVSDALLILLRSIEGFSEQNVTAEDFSILNNGVSKAIITLYDGFDQTQAAFDGRIETTWHIQLHTFAQTIPDVPSAQLAQDATRDAILAKLRRHPNLGNEPDVSADATEVDSVFDAFVKQGRPNPTPHTVGDISYMREIITMDVAEDILAEIAD